MKPEHGTDPLALLAHEAVRGQANPRTAGDRVAVERDRHGRGLA